MDTAEKKEFKDHWIVKLLLRIFATNWFDQFKKFYGGLIDLIGFIVDQTTNQGADIAIRALPAAAPLPNAFSMYYVSRSQLGFVQWQALAFAVSLELILFGLFEVAIRMFDGFLHKKKGYQYLFWLAMVIAVACMFLVMYVVRELEVVHPILSVLPLFSAAGAMALVLRRWDTGQQKDRITELEAAISALSFDNARLRGLANDRHRERQVLTQTESPIPQATTGEDPTEVTDTRGQVLAYLKTLHGQPVENLNRTNAAETLGITSGTLRYHIDQLKKKEEIILNGTIHVR